MRHYEMSSDSVAAARASCEMLRYLAPRLHEVRESIAKALIAACASPDPPESLGQLAAAANVSERHMRRASAAAGIRSPRLFLAASRVLRARADLISGRMKRDELARRHGFGTVRTLRAQWLAVRGCRVDSDRSPFLGPRELDAIAYRVFG
jgi:transcriptional regulator GlxA family with amidase domain